MNAAALKKKFEIDLSWLRIRAADVNKPFPESPAWSVRIRIPTTKAIPAKPLVSGWTNVGKVYGQTGDWKACRFNGWILRTGIDTRAEATDVVLASARKEGRFP